MSSFHPFLFLPFVAFSFLSFLFFLIFFNTCTFGHTEMTTKFNQEMYAKMKAKKNEPLSSLGKKVVRIVEKGTPITLVASVLEATRIASPITLMEEITPRPKR